MDIKFSHKVLQQNEVFGFSEMGAECLIMRVGTYNAWMSETERLQAENAALKKRIAELEGAAEKDCPTSGDKCVLYCTSCRHIWTQFVRDSAHPHTRYECPEGCGSLLTGVLLARPGKSVEGSKLNREARARGEQV